MLGQSTAEAAVGSTLAAHIVKQSPLFASEANRGFEVAQGCSGADINHPRVVGLVGRRRRCIGERDASLRTGKLGIGTVVRDETGLATAPATDRILIYYRP